MLSGHYLANGKDNFIHYLIREKTNPGRECKKHFPLPGYLL